MRHHTAPYTPRQNDVVERRNQTMVGMARSMMKAKKMPAEFWGEAVTTAVFILNRAPTKALKGKTQFKAWHGRKPNVSFLRTFVLVAEFSLLVVGKFLLSSREDDTRSWGNFLVYFSHKLTQNAMPTRGVGDTYL